MVVILQLNDGEADNSADEINAGDCDEQTAEKVSVSPVKTRKKRKKKAKDKSSSTETKAVVLCSVIHHLVCAFRLYVSRKQ